jgi:hypothetical protein
VPGKPIISGCEGPTARLSKLIGVYLKPLIQHIPSYVINSTDYLKPLIQHIPSYVIDSTDFLKRIFKLDETLPKEYILITIDVKSLYTNILKKEEIDASITQLIKHDTTGINTETIQKILELILENNYFQFNDKYYLQTHSTALAVSYASIFMATLEGKIFSNPPEGLIPLEWIRFLDDIFAIWCHGETSLIRFLPIHE